jgi:3-dehydroquinate synthetase
MYIEKNYRKLLAGQGTSLSHVVGCCSRIKARIVEKDERETLGLRTILNFGHTIGHGIEAAASYGTYQHGEAIALGMRVAAMLSIKMKLLTDKERQKIEALLTVIGLPQKIKGINVAAILKSIAHDKKNASKKNRFVLVKKIGHPKVVEGIPAGLIQKTIQAYLA